MIEPPDMFDDRLPEKYADLAPKVVETDSGHQVWRYGGATYPCAGLDVGATAREQWTLDPVRFEHMRPGCHDIEARIEDMDRAGVWGRSASPACWPGSRGWSSPKPATRSWACRSCARGTTGTWTSGRAPTRSGSSPCSFPG
ncbi:hypothetical protein ACFQX6_43240 [Streptosporangium lutulentum]